MFEIGNSLREARLRQGLDFPEIEQATKIRSKYLRALEEEQFEVLPAQTYVKGFLRSYSEYLGLDGQLYVDEFNSRYVRGEVEEEEQELRPPGGGGGSWGPRSSPMVSSAVLVVLILIGAVTALFFVAWKFGGEEPPRVPLPGNAIEQPAAKQPAPVARLVASAAQGNCYLTVYRGSRVGRPIYEGTLERGQERTFKGRKLFVHVLAPANLRLKLNGRPVVVPGQGQGPKRWLRVTTRQGVTVIPSAA